MIDRLEEVTVQSSQLNKKEPGAKRRAKQSDMRRPEIRREEPEISFSERGRAILETTVR